MFSYRSRKEELGIAAIELALVFPLFVLLLFGMMDLAVMMYNTQVITNASREGARWGVITNNNPSNQSWSCNTSSTVEASPCGVANRFAEGLLISFKGSPVSSTTATGGGTAGSTVTVVTTYLFNGVGFLPGAITLSAETKMNYE